jgi:hypothetical protein
MWTLVHTETRESRWAEEFVLLSATLLPDCAHCQIGQKEKTGPRIARINADKKSTLFVLIRGQNSIFVSILVAADRPRWKTLGHRCGYTLARKE